MGQNAHVSRWSERKWLTGGVLVLLTLLSTPAFAELYLANPFDDTVTFLEDTGDVTTISVGDIPGSIVITQKSIYVDLFGANIAVIDLATNTVVDTIAGVGGLLAVTRDEAFLYALGINRVDKIDLATNQVVGSTIDFPASRTEDFAVIGENWLWRVTADAVIEIDALTGDTVEIEIPDGNLQHLVIPPDEKMVFVADESNRTVLAIDPTTKTVVAVIPIDGASISDIAISPDGTRLYVAGLTLVSLDSVINVIDTATNTVTATIPVSADLLESGIKALEIAPDGKTLYGLTTLGDMVRVIDIDTEAVNTIPLDSSPSHIATRPGASGLPDGDGGTSDITWDVTGVDVDLVVCKNKTTGQKVRIDANVPTSGSCGDLDANPGDNIQVKAVGTVVSLADAGGNVTGITPNLVVCKNRSTDPKEKVRLEPPPSPWNCTDEGLPLAVGDRLQWKAKGPAN